MNAANKHGFHWAILAQRAVFLLVTSLAIYLLRTKFSEASPETNDLLIAGGIGGAIVAVLAATVFIRAFRIVTPYILFAADVFLAGIYVYLSDGSPLLLAGIAGFLAVSGLLHAGTTWGSLHATGVIAVTLGVIVYLTGQDALDNQVDMDLLLDTYTLPVLSLLLVVLSVGIWQAVNSFYTSYADRDIKAIQQETEALVTTMRERARSISEMSATLSSTLNYDKILEAALNIGQLSVRPMPGQRIASLVLLFGASEDHLYVAASRGLRHNDDALSIPATQGVIATTLDECEPYIGKIAAQDPVLRNFSGLRDIRSFVCLPLHAHYDNYGVLIYGSSKPDAFDPDSIDTLTSIGVQTTVALQNAVLYENLREEKERIIQMEEDARKALVRDLHDIPTQTISAVAMRLRIIQRLMDTSPDEVPGELETAEGMAVRATEEIRHVLFKLRPLALESQGLSAALEQLSEKLQQTYKQAAQFKVHPEVEYYLDSTQQGALFYLIEEAVNNARKYAEASLIKVQAVRQNNFIVVRISDNGVGFDAAQVNASYDERGSFGMVNMRERAELLEGTLKLESKPGKGTTITVLIPIDLSRTNGHHADTRPRSQGVKLTTSRLVTRK